jgi:hypothetical protein
MTKNWTIALLLLTVICCLWFILQTDKPADTHTAEHSIVEADNKAILKQRDSGLKIIDSLQKGITKRDALINELKSQLSFTRRDLDKSTAKAVQLAIKQLKDTSAYGRRCDSLASEALNFAWLYEQYKANSDSLATVVDKNSEDYVKALEVRRTMYDDLYSKYEQLYRQYNHLYVDNVQAGKKLRREKLKTKVAAVLGGALAIISLVK